LAKEKSLSVLDNVGDYILHHISNSSLDKDLILELPTVFGINLSVTKHVLMIWLTSLIVALIVIIPTRIFLKSKNEVPTGISNGIEAIVSFIKDSIVKPNIGSKWSDTWSPNINLFFFHISGKWYWANSYF